MRRWLVGQLLAAEAVRFGTRNWDQSGIYIVYRSGTPIYVGKTTRTGTVRLRELTSDYRSHTFNAKQMRRLISQRTKRPVNNLSSKTLAALKIAPKQLRQLQTEVNKYITSRLRVAFVQVAEGRLAEREHFAIAALSPEFND